MPRPLLCGLPSFQSGRWHSGSRLQLGNVSLFNSQPDKLNYNLLEERLVTMGSRDFFFFNFLDQRLSGLQVSKDASSALGKIMSENLVPVVSIISCAPRSWSNAEGLHPGVSAAVRKDHK